MNYFVKLCFMVSSVLLSLYSRYNTYLNFLGNDLGVVNRHRTMKFYQYNETSVMHISFNLLKNQRLLRMSKECSKYVDALDFQ
jgi:hypothetical protein